MLPSVVTNTVLSPVTRTLRRAPASLSPAGVAMAQVLERGAGLDVHKKTVAACARVPGIGGDRAQHVRPSAPRRWGPHAARGLEAHRVSHVAMESTGVDWRPVFYVLEDTLAYQDPGVTGTPADTPTASAAGPFTRWNATAIASRSNPRPEREVRRRGVF
jgi:hypothetical protein